MTRIVTDSPSLEGRTFCFAIVLVSKSGESSSFSLNENENSCREISLVKQRVLLKKLALERYFNPSKDKYMFFKLQQETLSCQMLFPVSTKAKLRASYGFGEQGNQIIHFMGARDNVGVFHGTRIIFASNGNFLGRF